MGRGPRKRASSSRGRWRVARGTPSRAWRARTRAASRSGRRPICSSSSRRGMEIERKYLVSGTPPEGREDPVEFVQGYVAIDSETEVRVRVAGEAAFLAVKTFR